jgi:anti-anti-sigma factor
MSRSCPIVAGRTSDSTDIAFDIAWSGPGSARLSGEFDLAAVVVGRGLLDVDGDVELECSGLTFIDASGLRLLVAVHRRCDDRGGTLAIVDPAPCVVRLLALTGLDSVLTVRQADVTR